MSEKEKMLAQQGYYPADDTLTGERMLCRQLCCEYNTLSFDKSFEKECLIKKILGKTGEQFIIEPFFQCDYGYNVEIGENFYSNCNLTILDPAKVIFGNNVLIGPNCGFYTPEHPLDTAARISGLEYAFPIIVGDNVWFGGNVTVLGGVTIGSDSVIGAGSVVTKDIPSGVIAAGNPCRIIREIDKDDKYSCRKHSNI